VLIDLSNDASAATEWALTQFGRGQFIQINKADLKAASMRQSLGQVRSLKPSVVSVFTSDVDTQSRLGALMLFGVLAGASRVVIGDRNGNHISRSGPGVLFLETPKLALELAIGFLLIIPISWLLTQILFAALFFRSVVRASRNHKPRSQEASTLYIRATLGSATEGGMRTHVAGFAGGAAALRRRLKFIESGSRPRDDVSVAIKPSPAFGATRALFELWNNLAFTAKSLQLCGANAGDINFIYQRYSRFNWTGVALSIVTGLPLALEFNGSEVWLSRQWDPVDQIWLLKRFERLNLHAADLIFVVTEVEQRNLIDARVDAQKIVVNPNGVDVDRFRPDRGGAELRRVLGIQGKTVIGFVGTFGPWHGAPMLAEAAKLVARDTQFHILFVGDGDQRAQTEAIVKDSNVSATFTGRVSHEEVPAYLDACDILVSPHVPLTDGSDFFGSPTKLFEYLAMAKPVIASRLGQVADVIFDGENGVLVEPGNLKALARAIDRLARDESLRLRLGAVGRKTVSERYTWRQNAARVFDAMSDSATMEGAEI
jgi:glycosyltransferase involved in cell wall biosynthesis